MKRLFFILSLLAVFSSCGFYGNGELTGVLGREVWFPTDPYGMVFIPMGSYNMGVNDQDVFWAMTTRTRTVTIHPFWMDETEITNNEYRQFVYWVRDSIAYKKLGESIEGILISENEETGETYDPPFINWYDAPKIDWSLQNEEQRDVINELLLPEQERFYRRKELDIRKLNFEYYWIDFQQAAKKYTFDKQKRRSYDFDNAKYDGEVTNYSVERKGDKIDRSNVGKRVAVKNRSSYIMKDVVNVYPDTLCWVSDFTYSYNEPMANCYFWHPAYDNYPVVGVNWKQAFAFCVWRTQLLNSYLSDEGDVFVQDFRLPKESEWEYAARGGLDGSMYPWGGYYTRNYTGCFIANFKPMRGNYPADGGVYPLIVASYDPNEWGLYDMAGNVAEWTSNAFDESAYEFEDDLNPDYEYNALPDDVPALKRKVIRGGSWKDVAFYLQCGTRTYEYMDTAKSYIGFRCVQTFLGRSKEDGGPSHSQVY